MGGLLSRFAACLILILSVAAHAAEEKPPDTRPILRIDAAMHAGVIRSIDISADGRFLVSGSDDKTARLWSLPDGELVRSFRVPIGEGVAGRIRAVAISPDGRTVAASGNDAYRELNGGELLPGFNFVYVFDAASGSLKFRLGPMLNRVLALKYSDDGAWLAAGMLDGEVRAWPMLGGGAAIGTTNDKHEAPGINGLAFSGNTLYAASSDGMIHEYAVAKGMGARFAALRSISAPGGKLPYGLAVSPDRKLLAVGYGDSPAVSLFTLPGLEPGPAVDTSPFKDDEKSGSVVWSADGQLLYAGATYRGPQGTYAVASWPEQGRGEPTLMYSPRGTVFDLAALPPNEVVYGAADPEIGFTQGSKLLQIKRVTAEMRNKVGGGLLVSQDGAGVRFGLEAGDGVPWRVDVAKLSFEPSPEPPADYVAPITDRMIDVRDWQDSPTPNIQGTPLKLLPNDVSHSLAIAPYGVRLVIGGEGAIYDFDDKVMFPQYRPVESPAWGVNYSGDGRLIVAAHGDGTIRWYSGIHKELLAFYVHVPDKRWIAWTPSGYYAASPGAEDLIGWHVNGKTWDETPQFYPASRFRDQFYRPDIVKLILKTYDEAKAVEQANAAAGKRQQAESIAAFLPATIELVLDAPEIGTAQQQLAVRYRLASPTGRAVTRVEARIDGRPVETRGMLRVADDYPLGEDLEAEVTLPPRDSELSIIAYIGEQPSVAARVSVKWTGAAPEAKKPKLHALLVGVSAYEDKKLTLNYAAKDASDFAEAIKAQEGRLYSAVEISTLLDGEATKSSVETALALLKKKAGPDDVAIVFLAGHGITDKALDFYFLTANANFDPDLLSANALDGAFLRKELAKVQGRVVLFMDACRAGAGIQGAVDMSRVSNDFALDTGGLVMFASSQGDVDSIESPIWENGAFTEALLAVLADPDAYGNDKMLSLPELEEALTTRVAELTENRQLPVMTKYGAIPRFFIAAAR
jgi:WD40 repeat protein